MHFKVKDLRGDYPNSSQNSALKPCKQCKCAVVFSKVLSDPFIFQTLWSIISSLDEPFCLNVGAMDISKLCPFHIYQRYFLGTGTL